MIGTKLGHYEITRHLGSGGMGDVYQATDTKLGRSVAIKLLPGALIHDAERLARFRREARVLASLNHPHICVLHEMATHEGIDYIVMEHLTGVPLSDRLSRGALPLDQALRYAIEIADALDKAHRQGVVHRDLKPANIMITSFGAKLLDFGLAKLRANGSEGAEGVSGLGTGEGLTVEGTIVGTLQYMAPEQLEGREADVRADIFSFGAILYEMLSGKKAFEGQSQASLIAAILKAEPPPISSLQPIVPPALDNLVRGCLSKDASDRWQTMHDVAKQLQWLSGAMTAAMPIPVPKRPRSFRVGIGAALVLAMVALAVLAFVYRRVPAGPSMRLTVAMPPAIALAVGENSPSSAVISPDGTRMVLMGVDQTTGKISLYVRAIDSVELQPLPGTEDAASPFWSPDSLSVAFFAQGKLQRVDLNGGPAKVICAAANSGAGTWNEDDVIVVSLSERGPLFRVSADGGTPTTVTSMNSATELDHDWPQFLPDGKHFLYVALSRNPAEQAIYVGSIDSQRGKLVAKGIGSPAVYAHPGHLLFFRAGALMVQAFDTEQMVLMGEPHRLAANAMPPFSASGTGTITYRGSPGTPDRFLWIDWEGRELGPVLQPGYYADPVLSPDGLRLAFARRETAGATFDIWILEFSSGRQRKLTTDTDDDRAPVWSPDGNSIAFWAKRQSGPGVYRKNSDGTGEEELLVPEKNDIWPYQWTGSNLLYFGGPGVSSYDAFLYSFADRKSRPLIQSPFVDADAAISPDGKWLAYETNETGRYEVYVSTFPTSNTKLVVTTESGVDSLWSPDGRTLFYVNAATRELLATEVKPGNPPEFGAPRRIYAGPLDWTSAHSFDIDARQKRILVQVSTAPQIDITVLLNWPADLKK